MKGFLNKLFRQNVRWEFHPEEPVETSEPLKNPARGWYTIYPFWLEKEPDFEELYWCLSKEETIALVIINIGAYREQSLDAVALERLERILTFFAKHSYDVILRITYDHEGNAVEREPFFFKIVQEHLKQLIPVVRKFSATVFIWQGMLIGNWGEMHTSRFLFPGKLKQLWSEMQNGLGDKVFLAVRRPSMWRMLHPEAGENKALLWDTTGLFDDAIFGSDSHLGTFGTKPKAEASWENAWCREDELEFETGLCSRVPNGGEVVCEEQYEEKFSAITALDVLRRMHITYLNHAHDERVLTLWKQYRWINSSFYDYVGSHLGYRFCLREVTVTPQIRENKLRVTLKVENTGFANCYQPADVLLEYTGPCGNHEMFKIETDVRNWQSGTTQELSCTLDDNLDGELYLRILRKSDSRTIRFANRSQADGSVLLGSIAQIQQ